MAVAHFSRDISTGFATEVKTSIDAGSGSGLIKFYTSPMPADTTVSVSTQTLLGTCTCSDPVGTLSGGTLTFSSISQDPTADASGVASWCRITDSNNVVACDLDVTVTGGGGFVQMVSTTIVAGGPLAFTSLTMRLP